VVVDDTKKMFKSIVVVVFNSKYIFVHKYIKIYIFFILKNYFDTSILKQLENI
jgi:hypothetical protein